VSSCFNIEKCDHAIQILIESGIRVYAIKLKPEEVRLDVGTPETYWEALQLSHEYALRKRLLGL